MCFARQSAILLCIAFVVAVTGAYSQPLYLPALGKQRPTPVVEGMLKVRLSADVAANANSVLESMGLTIVRPLIELKQTLRFKLATNAPVKVSVQHNIDEALRLEDALLRTYVVKYDDVLMEPERKIAMLRVGCGPIECAAPWCVMELASEPNDPERTRQELLQTIRVYDAWDVEEGDSTVVIGISDSGVFQEHEDLRDALAMHSAEIENNGIDDDGNGYVDDFRGYNFSAVSDNTSFGDAHNPQNGHGTAVAGICGATVDNGIGIAGIARKCKIFPLRTMPNNSSGIVYGYESILYCAVNEFAVVNCSWGSQSRSCIDEDVVAYAIARGTAVVAAAGNHASPTPFYPASYTGVLSVGVTSAGDAVIRMSGHGPTVDVMAPGQDSWSTNHTGGYSGFCCTSGSAPIVSAVVALARSANKTLSPLQACALVRESVRERPWTDIPSGIDELLLPRGVVDAYRSVTNKADSVVSVRVDSVVIRAKSGGRRWSVGDTLSATLSVTNVLAPWEIRERDPLVFAGSQTTALSTLSDDQRRIDRSLATGERFTLPEIRLRVERETDTASYLVFDLLGSGLREADVTRRVMVAVTPSPAFVTLENEELRVSIGDRGRIGNTDLERGQGEGLTHRGFCGQLYEGGLMVSANGKVVDAVRARRRVNDHFRPIKRFQRPDPYRSVIRDDDAPDSMRIGVEIEQTVTLDSGTATLVVDVVVRNVSTLVLYDLAVGWFFDWDLGTQPAKNRTARIGQAQIVYPSNDSEPHVQLVTTSLFTDANAITAGIDNTTTYSGLLPETKLKYLNSGDSLQYLGVNDVSVVVGMRFGKPVHPGHYRSFRLVIGLDTMPPLDGTVMKGVEPYLLSGAPFPYVDIPNSALGLVYPNPVADMFYIPLSRLIPPYTLAVYDLRGREMYRTEMLDHTPAIVPVSISDWSAGNYSVQLSHLFGIEYQTLIITR